MFNTQQKSNDKPQLSFKLKTKEAELDFNGGNLSDEHVTNILDNIIRPNLNPFMAVEAIAEPIKFDIQPNIVESGVVECNLGDLPIQSMAIQTKRTDTSKENTSNTPRSRKLPIVGEENRGTTPIAEILGDKLQGFYDQNPPEKVEAKPEDKEPDFYHTGVKYKSYRGDDNVPHFRAHYNCPRCGQSGRHYIPEKVDVISCHNCQSKLNVEPATKKGFKFAESHRDESGNFFVANTLKIDNSPMYTKK